MPEVETISGAAKDGGTGSSPAESAQPKPDQGANPGGTGQPAKTESKPGEQPKSDPKPAGEKPTRPDWLPEQLWDADKGFKGDDFNALVASKAETDSRLAAVPEKPEGYKVQLPADFKTPEGFELPKGESLIDENDPRVKVVRDVAHANKWSQADFERVLEMGVQADIQERGRLKEAVTEERTKLGGRAVERINAVTQWLDAKLGAEAAGHLHGMMFTAKSIEAFERLMQLNRGDVPGRPGAERDAKPQQVSDDEWDRMTPVQKINYARERSPAPVKQR